MRWGANGDLLLEDAAVANCLLLSNSVFLRASRSRMANVLLLLSHVACYLSWNLGCFCHSELSPVFLNIVHVNPFFTFLHCHQTLGFMRDFILLGRTSRRSRGTEYVVNTKAIHQAWLLPLDLSHNYTHLNLRVDWKSCLCWFQWHCK